MAAVSVGDKTSTNPKGPRTQIKGFWGPNTINVMVFGT